MKIQIHRGQNQIGGSIIEISTQATRLFFDVGTNLGETTINVIPDIKGLFSGNKNCDAVFISHYHSDHIGLLDNLLPDIPVYMGEKAYQIYHAAANYRSKEVHFLPNYIYNKQTIEVGDILITPFLCDHSAFDSYMFLIEADNKSILYTGDFRANGRLNFEELLRHFSKIDAVIIEGTTLTRATDMKNIEEEKLEEIAINYLKKHTGPAFIMMSAMNIERIITAYHVAQKTNRLFLEDLYTADLAMAAGHIAPEPDIDTGIRVFMTGGDHQYRRLLEYGKAKIGKHEIVKHSFLMCVRQSMRNYLEKLNDLISFENGVLFYGMWKGYMEQPEMQEFIDFMQRKGVTLHILHTSGHADAMTIDRLIRAISPKLIVPVHTENPEWFHQYAGESNIVYHNIVEV